MAPDDIINENDGEQEEEQEQEPNIIDLNNYGMKPYSWRYEGSGGGGGSFDPDITDPQDGDTLVYNATQQKWVNGAGSSGGGVLVVHIVDGTLDKTWKEIHDAMASGELALALEEDGTSVYQSIISALTMADNSFNVFVVGQNLATDEPIWAAESIDGYPAEL